MVYTPQSPENRANFVHLCAGAGFALMNMFVRLSGDITFQAFFRNLSPFWWRWSLPGQKPVHASSWRKGHRPLVLRLSKVGTIGILCNFYAVDRAFLADLSHVSARCLPFLPLFFLSSAQRRKGHTSSDHCRVWRPLPEVY